jgi:hypothetical protein
MKLYYSARPFKNSCRTFEIDYDYNFPLLDFNVWKSNVVETGSCKSLGYDFRLAILRVNIRWYFDPF